jgi:hypothetical protein
MKETTKLRVLTRVADVSKLSTDCVGNAALYQQDTPWLGDVLPSPGWEKEYRDVEVPADWTLIIPGPKENPAASDSKNVRIVYGALKGLTLTQATDSRIWVYLTHVQFWNYMRKRWPLEKQLARPKWEDRNTWNYIVERYLLKPSNRLLLRNGISRLWWAGHATYDETRDDPFELTDVLLSKQDIALQLLDRNPSRNGTFSRAFLTVVQQEEEDGVLSELSDTRKVLRRLVNDTTLLAGVKAIDLLDFSELVVILTRMLKEIVQMESDQAS